MASGFNDATHGATLTSEQVESILIEPLKAQSVVLNAGPRIFDAPGGDSLHIPKLTSLSLNDPWKSENQLISESDPLYGELVLLPSSLKSMKVLHRFSNELARKSVVSIAQTMQTALAAEVARAIDRTFLVGTGADNTPVGIAKQTGVQAIDFAGGYPTPDWLFKLEGMLLTANARPESAVWFMHPRELVTLRRYKSQAGDFMLQPDISKAGGYTLLGYPVFITTQIPINEGASTNQSTMIFADMSQVAVGRDVDAEIELLTERFADYDQQALRIVARWDIGLLNAPGVIVCKNIGPSPDVSTMGGGI